MARKQHYIFTNKKHSPKAIMSTILGIISMVSLVAVIYLTYLKTVSYTHLTLPTTSRV